MEMMFANGVESFALLAPKPMDTLRLEFKQTQPQIIATMPQLTLLFTTKLTSKFSSRLLLLDQLYLLSLQQLKLNLMLNCVLQDGLHLLPLLLLFPAYNMLRILEPTLTQLLVLP
jgi:hypothetical protein